MSPRKKGYAGFSDVTDRTEGDFTVLTESGKNGYWVASNLKERK